MLLFIEPLSFVRGLEDFDGYFAFFPIFEVDLTEATLVHLFGKCHFIYNALHPLPVKVHMFAILLHGVDGEYCSLSRAGDLWRVKIRPRKMSSQRRKLLCRLSLESGSPGVRKFTVHMDYQLHCTSTTQGLIDSPFGCILPCRGLYNAASDLRAQ